MPTPVTNLVTNCCSRRARSEGLAMTYVVQSPNLVSYLLSLVAWQDYLYASAYQLEIISSAYNGKALAQRES